MYICYTDEAVNYQVQGEMTEANELSQEMVPFHITARQPMSEAMTKQQPEQQ